VQLGYVAGFRLNGGAKSFVPVLAVALGIAAVPEFCSPGCACTAVAWIRQDELSW
jgi:hypothetical protein